MKLSPLIVVVVLGVLILFIKSSGATTTVSKTAGVTPATAGALSNVIAGLVNIFGSSDSAYAGGSAPEGSVFSSVG
jgi:hypothetical protein